MTIKFKGFNEQIKDNMLLDISSHLNKSTKCRINGMQNKIVFQRQSIARNIKRNSQINDKIFKEIREQVVYQK